MNVLRNTENPRTSCASGKRNFDHDYVSTVPQLLEALLQLRNSKHAIRFRQSYSIVCSLLSEIGRGSAANSVEKEVPSRRDHNVSPSLQIWLGKGLKNASGSWYKSVSSLASQVGI